MSARSKRSTGSGPVEELPAGFDDEASPYFVPVELREDCPAARPTLDAVHATERALARQLAEQEAAAVQEPRVRAAIEQARSGGNARRAAELRRLFYGGGLSRVTVESGRTWAEPRAEHPFRPRHDPVEGFRIDLDRELSPAERDRAAHLARLDAAAGLRRARVQREQWRVLHTCELCREFDGASVRRRTVKVTGSDQVVEQARLCDGCEAAFSAELRRRRDAARLQNGRTRRELAAAWLTARAGQADRSSPVR